MIFENKIKIKVLQEEIRDLRARSAATTDPLKKNAIDKLIEEKEKELIALETEDKDIGAKAGKIAGKAGGYVAGRIISGITSPIDDILHNGGKRDQCAMRGEGKRMAAKGEEVGTMLGRLLGIKRK